MAANAGTLCRVTATLRRRLTTRVSIPARTTFLSQQESRPLLRRNYAATSDVVNRKWGAIDDPVEKLQEELEVIGQPKGEASNDGAKVDTSARNNRFRSIFKARDVETEALVGIKLKGSPFVPDIRTYPNKVSENINYRKAFRAARVQVAQDKIWEHHGQSTPTLNKILDTMRSMSNKVEDGPQMEAMRVLLPDKVDFALPSRRLEYVESATGLLAKLSVSIDHPNPDRGIVLRGKGPLLARAADEMIHYNKDIKVFRLGRVTTFDYDARQLWPSVGLDDAKTRSLKDFEAAMSGESDNIWLHREGAPNVIVIPYEKISKPKKWTKVSFHKYISTIIQSRLKTSLITRIYGKAADADGKRIALIMETFENSELRHCITPATLNHALNFIMWRGGHRATGERLFNLAQEWGVPIDTTTFNIMLGGYVTIQSTAHFHRILKKMHAGFYAPNTRTWLHLLRLVEKDDARRSIIVNMYDHGAFSDPAARREIAKVMAPHDLHVALRTSQSLTRFCDNQAEQYGGDWFTIPTLVNIIDEFFMFYDDIEGADRGKFEELLTLIKRQPDDGDRSFEKPVLAMLQAAIARKNWDIAIAALKIHKEFGCEPDEDLYAALVDLAIVTQTPHVLGALLIHGLLTDMLPWRSRRHLQRCLLSTHPLPFWRRVKLHCFTGDMQKEMLARDWASEEHPIELVSKIVKKNIRKDTIPTDSITDVVTREYLEHDVPWTNMYRSNLEGEKVPEFAPLVLKLDTLKGLHKGKTVEMRLTRWVFTGGATKTDKAVLEDIAKQEGLEQGRVS